MYDTMCSSVNVDHSQTLTFPRREYRINLAAGGVRGQGQENREVHLVLVVFG